jgi:type I restriction enzyme ecoAI specificity protein
MNTKQLRQTILDLAIRGELVPQDPSDEPASVLLERIRAEKEQLIKDKKLKRDKKESEPIDEVPFELPEGWEWCRLKEITTELKYGTSEKSSLEGKIPVLRMGNITTNGTIDYSNIVFSSNEEDIKEFLLTKGNLVFNRTNSSDLVGKTAIYRGEIPAIFAGYLIKIALLKVNPEYTNLAMNSSYYRKWCYSVKSDAVNQSNINAEKLSNLLIPLPPLAEQHRIVQKIEQLLTIVDTIEQLQEELKALIKQTKNQVLNYAIAGKLTHQDPNDEPAEELLKRIGKTTAADTPYEKLPKGWAWCRLGDIGEIIGGGTPSTSIEEYWNGEVSWITPADLSNYSDKYIAQGKRNITQLGLDNSSAKLIPKGSILFSTRAPIGYVVIADRPLSTNQGFKSLSLSINMSEEFVYYFLLAEKERIKLLASGTTFQELSASAFSKILIPLPPLAEQHRIVQQIKNYFTAFDQIEKELA